MSFTVFSKYAQFPSLYLANFLLRILQIIKIAFFFVRDRSRVILLGGRNYNGYGCFLKFFKGPHFKKRYVGKQLDPVPTTNKFFKFLFCKISYSAFTLKRAVWSVNLSISAKSTHIKTNLEYETMNHVCSLMKKTEVKNFTQVYP